MRFDVKRLLGVSVLSIFLGLGMAGCSGQQQAEEGVEVSEQGDGQGAENQAAENVAEANSQATNQAEEGADATTANASNNAVTEDAPSGSENDLQEIIQEMNGQPAAETAAASTTEASQAAVPAPAEAAPEATAEQASAAPAAPAQQAAAPAEKAPAAMPFQPGGTPAGAGLPEIGSKMAYVVEQGDTLGKISKKIYGTPSRWNELASLSGVTNPSRIFPGDVIYYTLDEKAVSFAQAYEGAQRMEIQVGQGETLATLAKRVYGTSKAWRSIWRQNDKIDNPDVVPPGSVIYYVPMGSSTAQINKNQNTISKSTAEKLSNKTSNSNKIAKTIEKQNTKTYKNKSINKIVAQQNVNQNVDKIEEISSFLSI